MKDGGEDRYAALERRVDELERFQSWVKGIFVAVAVVGAFLADKLKKVLGIGS